MTRRLALFLMGMAVLPVQAQPLLTGQVLDLDRAEPLPGVRTLTLPAFSIQKGLNLIHLAFRKATRD